jgi:hypothetical protein
LINLQGGDIEFVVGRNDINDPFASVFPARARFTVPLEELLDHNDEFIFCWKQSGVYPSMSQAILSALKSTPHGLTTILNPADPSQGGLLADFAIQSLDSVIDTMDVSNQNYLEFSMVGQPNQHFGLPILLKIIWAVKAKGMWARLNVHLKGSALGTLCGFLPTFCSSTDVVTATSTLIMSIPLHSGKGVDPSPVKRTASAPMAMWLHCCTPLPINST